MFKKIIALVLIPAFLFSNLSFASEIMLKERAERFEKAWIDSYAALLTDKTITKVNSLNGKITLAEAEAELIRQIKGYSDNAAATLAPFLTAELIKQYGSTPSEVKGDLADAVATNFNKRASASGASTKGKIGFDPNWRIAPQEATYEFNALKTIGSFARLKEFYHYAEINDAVTWQDILNRLESELKPMLETLSTTRPTDELTKLIDKPGLKITQEQLDILRSTSEFILQLTPDKKGVTNANRLKRVKQVFVRHSDIAKMFIDYFEMKFNPDLDLDTRGKRAQEIGAKIHRKIRLLERVSKHDHRTLFQAYALMLAVVKTDYYLTDRTELFFKIDSRVPKLFDLGHALGHLPQTALIWVHVPYGGEGVHSRYAEQARGGVRRVDPNADYRHNKVMSEGIALSYIQHKKHMDISEGGAKGTVRPGQRLNTVAVIVGYIDALINCKRFDERISAASDVDEFIDTFYLGPDEGTSEMATLATALAHMRGLPDWRTLMTGKHSKLGGFEHKINNLLKPHRKGNRVTSQGVVAHAIEMMRYRIESGAIKPAADGSLKFSLTGGPNGDVGGGNLEGLVYHYKDKARIVSICDVTAVVFDPAGLDHKELLRLYDADQPLSDFKGKLHEGGFCFVIGKDSYVELGLETLKYMNRRALDPELLEYLGVADHYRTMAGLKDDEPLVAILERDKENCPARIRVHATYLRDVIFFLAKADMFITGGGVRDSINNKNWQLFFDNDGVPVVNTVVHGANVFTTSQASRELENRGVVIEPDFMANSVGVEISSKAEVDFNTIFDIEEVSRPLMSAYFEQVLARCLSNARRKFFALRIEAENNPEDSVVTSVAPRMSERVIRFAQIIKRSHILRNGDGSYSPTSIECLTKYFPDVSSVDKRYKSTVERVLRNMPSDRVNDIVSKMIAAEIVLSLGSDAVARIKTQTGRRETEIMEAYLKIRDKLNAEKRQKDIIDNAASLSPKGQIEQLRSLRKELVDSTTEEVCRSSASGEMSGKNEPWKLITDVSGDFKPLVASILLIPDIAALRPEVRNYHVTLAGGISSSSIEFIIQNPADKNDLLRIGISPNLNFGRQIFELSISRKNKDDSYSIDYGIWSAELNNLSSLARLVRGKLDNKIFGILNINLREWVKARGEMSEKNDRHHLNYEQVQALVELIENDLSGPRLFDLISVMQISVMHQLSDVVMNMVRDIYPCPGKLLRVLSALRYKELTQEQVDALIAKNGLTEPERELIGIICAAETKGVDKGRSSSSGVAASHELTQELLPTKFPHVVEQLENMMRQTAAHKALSEDNKLSLSQIAIIANKNFLDPYAEGKDPQLSLKQLYQVKKQSLEKTFYNDGRGIVEVNSKEDLEREMRSLIEKGIKVVVLDDGSLTGTLDEAAIPKGDACVITTEKISENIGNDTIRFINLDMMALMGVSVLRNDAGGFALAYQMFTGEDPDSAKLKKLVEDLTNGILRIIRALPRIVRFNPEELNNSRNIRKLFDVSA